MTDKDIKGYCKNCGVEPPAMRFKCPECEHNPDKEQIIIDNVSNFCLVCYYDNKNKELVRIEQYKDGSGDIQTDIESHKYGYNAKIIKPEELIKQLARKTQECEEYKKLAVYFKDVNKQLSYKYLTIKHKCEELEEELELNTQNAVVIDMSKRLYGYRKALEEIEEVWAKDEDGDYDFVKWKILDIINRAKGE